jgi:hypothetical protein
LTQALFHQLGLVSSLLAGFAFTFFASLLSASPDSGRPEPERATGRSRAYTWVFVGTLLSALSLMVAAVACTFAGIALEGRPAGDPGLLPLHQLASQAFLLGTVSLMIAAGGSGWLRSRRLGWVTVSLAAFALAAVVFVVGPFLAVAS